MKVCLEISFDGWRSDHAAFSGRRGLCLFLTVWAILVAANLFPIGSALRAQDKPTGGGEVRTASPEESASVAPDTAIKVAGQVNAQPASAVTDTNEYEPVVYSVFEPGQGFAVARLPKFDLWISAYAVWRYVNQLPGDQSFTDHLGRQIKIDTRNDLEWHRIMVHFRGFAYSPKLRYVITVWNVLSTLDMYIIGSLTYSFSHAFNLSVGLDAVPGTRSLLGSHPLWLANDRVLADDFIRPGFSSGMSVSGEVLPGFWYKAVLNNNLSQIGLKANQLTRNLAYGGTLWWMPTTGEFGPRGAYGDYEAHEKLATRFGVCASAMHNEDRYNPTSNPTPGSTQIRLADSRLLFETGALADNVTVQSAAFRILSFDAGFKYHGIFLQTEFSMRWLDNFVADGPLPVNSIVDRTYYIQAAFFPIPKTLELYGATSQIYGDKSVGFSHSYEYLVGLNFYPFDERYFRVNAQVINIYHSPASSTFGFYVGGQTGTILSVATSLFF